MSRALGVDLGSVRIGLATSVGGVAVPAETLHLGEGAAGDPEAVARRLDAAAADRDSDVIVVGLPRGLSGRDTASTRYARTVAAALERYGRTVVLFDERLTSVQADRALADAGRSSRARRADVDQFAAAIILQAWLDAGEARG